MQLSQSDLENIILEVARRVEKAQADSPEIRQALAQSNLTVQAEPSRSQADLSGPLLGVFDKMEDAIESAYAAQRLFTTSFQLRDRERIIAAIREACRKEAENFARMAVEETKLGRYEDKIQKNWLVIDKTPGTEDLTTQAITGDNGLTIVEPAPFGVIGAITPTTNPTETIINNSISMLSGGNSVCFNVHPSAKRCCAYAVHIINQAILSVCSELKYLVTMVRQPTMDTIKVLTDSPKIRLMVGTGGMPMVKALLSSGKKTIGAGAGNPPVVVDETADIDRAAKEIFKGASFDNNLLCLAEKEVFVVDSVADDLIFKMIQAGAYLLNKDQQQKIKDLVLEKEDVPCNTGCSGNVRTVWHTSKNWVGRDAGLMLEKIGVTGHRDTRLLIFEADFADPFVQLEQLMPVLPIVRCRSIDDAIEKAVKAEHGNRHTASIFSKNIDILTRFARAIETTIFVKNACTLAGVGFGGEGHTTMTIAGPTGEGLTSPRSFTRQRRCALADGGLRII